MRGAIHKIHRWIGLALCVPLVTIGLTGSVLVFQHELGDTHYDIAKGTAHPAGEIIAAAKAVAPEGFSPSMIRLPDDEANPAMVFLTPERKGPGAPGKRVQVIVDPVSLAILNKDASGSVMKLVLQFHSSLFLRDFGGRSIVGWFGAVMIAFGVTGLVLWWPRGRTWKQAFTLKRGASGLRFHRDVHGMAGIWGFLLFFTVSFTGIYLAFPQSMDGFVGSVFSARDLRTPPSVVPVKDKKIISLDEAIAIAQTSQLGNELVLASFPQKPDQPYRITFTRPHASDGTPGINVFVDPWSKAIIETRDPKEYSLGETIMTWQRPLHQGQGLGWFWRVLECVVGVMPLVFAYTGISMWLIKRKARMHKAN